MKITTFVVTTVLIVVLALNRTAIAQIEAQMHPEPDLAGIFYRLDADKLVPLERQSTAAIHGKVGFSVKVTAELGLVVTVVR